jgi:hypothetical protein
MPAQCCKDKWPTIPDDEPVFVIRGQDLLAARAVAHWMDMAAEKGVNDTKLAAVAQHLKAIVDFQGMYPERCKVPD